MNSRGLTEKVFEEQTDTACNSTAKRRRISVLTLQASSMKEISSKISIRPFTSDKDLAERKRPVVTNVKKEKLGFMTLTLKKPRSLRPYEPTQHRMKWSKEVEKVPTLDIINSSSAMVGGALSNTQKTQRYSSSSYNNKNMILGAFKEGGKPFILPRSTGDVISQQFHRVLRICPSEPYKGTKNSPPEGNSNKDFVLAHVPLCFDDELERQNVKVLTARPPTDYTLPIVSETYPVIYNTDQYQYEPFKSPGFHFLETPKPLLQNCCVLNSKSHYAVIRNTVSMQDPRSKRIGERSIEIPRPQNSPYIGNKTTRARSVHMLLADGNVTKCLNNSLLFVHHHDVTSPGVFSNATRSPPVPFLMPRQRSTQVHVGPVVNGINPIPNHAKRSPSDNLKMTTGKLTRCSHVTQPQSQKSTAKQNGTDFLVISKALQNQQKSDQRHDFDTKQHFHEEFWSKEKENISHIYEMLQVSDDKHFGLNDESLSRPNSSPKHTLDQAPELSTLEMLHSVDDSNTCSETIGSVNDSETLKSNHDVQWSHAINIPTAESSE